LEVEALRSKMNRLRARTSDIAPPSSSARPTPSGIRGAIDALVQSALVELFTAYDVAVAPLPRYGQQPRLPAVPEVSAAALFTLQGRSGPPGRLTLSLPSALLDNMNSSGTLKGDWTRELASQLIGRIKNRLLQFSVRMELGVSSMLDSKALASHLAQGRAVRIYSGRTLRGELLVTLEGMPEESQLEYVGPVHVASEGTGFLF
jgi:hypothetical protein